MHDKVFDFLRWLIALDARNTLRATRLTQRFTALTNLPSRWLLWGLLAAQGGLIVLKYVVLVPDGFNLISNAITLVWLGYFLHATSRRAWPGWADPEHCPPGMVPLVVLGVVGIPAGLLYSVALAGGASWRLVHDLALALPPNRELKDLLIGLGNCGLILALYLARTPPIDPQPRERRAPHGQRA